MFSIKQKVIGVAIIIIALSEPIFAAGQIKDKDRANTQAAIIMINHVNWVVNRIKSSDDVGMLELEYEGISLNKLNLQSIKDQETIDQITRICDYITTLRISDGERKMLVRELNYNLDNAVYDLFPSPALLMVADPRAIAINLVQSTASAYFNYKRAVSQLKIQHERKMWNLEADAMRELNGLNVELLNQQWRLIQSYHLDDYWRVSEEQIKTLLSRLDSQISAAAPDELFNYLNHPTQRKTYQKLPAFWYYLGVQAEKCKHPDVALAAYEEYQKEFYQVLRFDRTAASVAMNKILLSANNTDKNDIYSQLKIIEANAPDDWTFLYFCANIYFDRLADKANAERVLSQAINKLQFQFSETLFNCRELCKKGDLAVGDHTFPNATPLIACKNLLLRIQGQENDRERMLSIADHFRKETTKNCFGMLSFVGKLPYEDICNYLKPELRAVFIDYQYDNSWKSTAPYRLVLYLPLSWFYAGNFDVEMQILFADDSSPMSIKLHPRYKDKNPVIMEDELVRYVFDCPNSIVRNKLPIKIEVLLKHKFYPITIGFDASGLKNAAGRGITNLRMYSETAKYKNKELPVR